MIMRIRAFFDSNIIIYAFLRDEIGKGDIALELIRTSVPIISTQVLNECANIFLRKIGATPSETKGHLGTIKKFCETRRISEGTIDLALDIKTQYGYSYYDSLILSTAIENECKIVYSEDMQHQQIIENLQIINPFAAM